MTKNSANPQTPTLFKTTKSAALVRLKTRLKAMKNGDTATVIVRDGDEIEIPFMVREVFGPSVVMFSGWKDRGNFDKNCIAREPAKMLVTDPTVFDEDLQSGLEGYFNAGRLPPTVFVLKQNGEEPTIPDTWGRRFRMLATRETHTWPTLATRDVGDWNSLFEGGLRGATATKQTLEHIASLRRATKIGKQPFTVKDLLKVADDAAMAARQGLRRPAEIIQPVHLLAAWASPTNPATMAAEAD